MSADAVRTWAVRSVVLLLLINLLGCQARDIFSSRLSQIDIDEPSFSRTRKSDWELDKDCAVHQVEHVHMVMDRVCLMCHEMFSHQHNTLRFECRQNCFDNAWFRKCLTIFTAPAVAPEKNSGRGK